MNHSKIFGAAIVLAMAACAAYVYAGTIVQSQRWFTDKDGTSIQVIAASTDTLAPIQIGPSVTDGIGVTWRKMRHWPSSATASARYACTSGDSAAFHVIVYTGPTSSGPWIAQSCSLVVKSIAKTTAASNYQVDTPAWSSIEGAPLWIRPILVGGSANSDTLTFSEIRLDLFE